MGLTMHERQAFIREFAWKFRQAASKKERSQIVDQWVSITGYSRWYTTYALRLCGIELVWVMGGRRVVFIPGQPACPEPSANGRLPTPVPCSWKPWKSSGHFLMGSAGSVLWPSSSKHFPCWSAMELFPGSRKLLPFGLNCCESARQHWIGF